MCGGSSVSKRSADTECSWFSSKYHLETVLNCYNDKADDSCDDDCYDDSDDGSAGSAVSPSNPKCNLRVITP